MYPRKPRKDFLEILQEIFEYQLTAKEVEKLTPIKEEYERNTKARRKRKGGKSQ